MSKNKMRFISPEEHLEMIRSRTPTERFDLLMRLLRLSRMMAEARVAHEKKK